MKISVVLSLAVLTCVLFPSEALPQICLLPAKPGFCKGYFPRYYWNDSAQKCEGFVYGGCSGNGNNFDTLEDCVASCGPGADDNALE